MHFKDGSPYNYFNNEPDYSTTNIGWLEENDRFDKEVANEYLLKTLETYICYPVLKTRGIHYCNLCRKKDPIEFTNSNGRTFALGSSEIRVFSSSKIFASPDLIYHYVKSHNYKPPIEFVEAAMNGPKPPEKQYIDLLENKNLKIYPRF